MHLLISFLSYPKKDWWGHKEDLFSITPTIDGPRFHRSYCKVGVIPKEGFIVIPKEGFVLALPGFWYDNNKELKRHIFQVQNAPHLLLATDYDTILTWSAWIVVIGALLLLIVCHSIDRQLNYPAYWEMFRCMLLVIKKCENLIFLWVLHTSLYCRTPGRWGLQWKPSQPAWAN